MSSECSAFMRWSIAALLLLACAVVSTAAPLQIRVATYNCSLNRSSLGQLATDLAVTTNAQARQVAETLQRVRPDVVLLNEFDIDPANPNLARDRFHTNYLAVSQNSQAALNYPYRYSAISNTGVSSGFDLNNNGVIDTTPGDQGYGDDSFGFGEFTGKYSFVVYSKYPIQTAAIRTFQLFKWKDMPGHVMPPGYYSVPETNAFRLSSKNHVDLPIELAPGQVLHLLASHPTPPSFDGTEDRNGRRNHDEIRFWKEYVNGAGYIYDDAGVFGGLGSEERFIILGDLNADPLDGDSYASAINQLLTHPRIDNSAIPTSPGGPQQSTLQGGKNLSHLGNPANDTADFGDGGTSPGNLRVDHVLGSKHGLSPIAGAVFWPLNSDPTFSLVSASDHRLVRMDFNVLPVVPKAVRELMATNDGADVLLSWKAQAGITYSVQTSSNLTAWGDMPGIVPSIDASLNGTARVAGAASVTPRFYRLVCTIEAPAPARSKRRR
jgi:hypothetical protein